MDLLLIKNADVYAPKHLGRQDVLINGGKIVRIGTDLETSYGSLSVEVVDASGLVMTPGFVDQHVHVIGAGGEAGYFSRTPEMRISCRLPWRNLSRPFHQEEPTRKRPSSGSAYMPTISSDT